jgi:DNA-binding NtrC family response regulator
LELQRKIAEIKPATSIMIMTGYHLDDEQQPRGEHGEVEWLQKPFTVKQLTLTVGKVLARARMAHDEQEESHSN